MQFAKAFRQVFLGVSLTLIFATLAGAAEIERTFARGVYWPWELTAGNAKAAGKDTWQFADNFMGMLKNDWHVNVIWFVNGPAEQARICDLAEKHGIAVILGTPLANFMVWGIPSESQLAKAAQAAVAPVREKKSFAAYVLKDEPLAREATQQELYRRTLAQADPTRPGIVVSMTGDTETYVNKTGFPIICTDIYHFGGPHSPAIPNPASSSQGSYRNAVTALVEMCARRNKSFWVMPQVFCEAWGPWWLDEQGSLVLEPGCYWHWRTPTAAETHWQTWEAVRAGSRGVVYFSTLLGVGNDWTPDKGPMPKSMKHMMEYAKTNKFPAVQKQVRTGEPPCLTLPGGKPTAQGNAMGDDFAFLERIEKALLSFRPTHLQAAFAAAPATVKTFESDKNPSLQYAVVVNDDLQSSQLLAIHFLPNVATVKNLRDNSVLPLADEVVGNAGLRSAAIQLGPGEGTVLQIEFRDGAPGLDLFHEDFSEVNMSVSAENVERRIEGRGFGLGWQYTMRKANEPTKEGKITLTGLQHVPGQACIAAGAMERAAQGTDSVFLYVEGQFPQAESMAVNIVEKNDASRWIQTNNFHLPCRVPPETKSIELILRPDAVVRSISLWRVPRPKDGK